MSRARRLGFLSIVLLSLSNAGRAASTADDNAAADEAFLKKCGVATDGPGLLDFFGKRTLKDADRERLAQLVRRLGDNFFGERERAQRELIQAGTPALPSLRAALKDPDLEISRRAERCIAEIEGGPGSAVPAAVARLMAARKTPGAIAVLLRYIPFADDAFVEGEVLGALCILSSPADNVEPTLTEALKDGLPPRRAAAAFVLGRHADVKVRRQVQSLLADADARVRFRAVQGLIAGKEKSAIPELVNLLVDVPLEQAARAEELLQRIAGPKTPEAFLGDGSEAARKTCQAAWMGWWREHGANVDLSKLDEGPQLLGLTVAIEYNTNRVWESGLDGKMRWQVTAQGPMDAQVLPGNRVLIAESNGHRVSERDFKGAVLWQKEVAGEPINCQRLASGNTFIGLRNGAMEVTRDGKEVFTHIIGGTFHGVRRLGNGHFVYITSEGVIGEVDAVGKKLHSVTLKHEGTWGDVDKLPNGNYLVTNYGVGFVREVDAEGKTVWDAKVTGACGGDRLPNGHILLACPQRAVVVDRAGKILWEAKSDGFVRRAHRR